MSIWMLTDADVEAVVNQLKSGKTVNEVAADLEISAEMVTCAVRKWPALNRRHSVAARIWGF